MFPALKSQFLLNPDITFLNFGSFGACPKPIFNEYQRLQVELEYEPVQFITVKGLRYLDESRLALAEYLHADKDDLVYVSNPSFAVNSVAKSFPLQAGDEVLTTNIEYGACDKTWQYYCDKAGAKYVKNEILFPIQSKEEFIQHFSKGITAKTKLIFISHITSVTGLRLPIEEICTIANQRGILIFIDGAHAPGHIKVNLSELNADFYTGACHKWMMTPKGSSFLYVKKEHQHLIDPLVISWGYNSEFPSESQFLDYHQLQGTRDFTAFLTIPTAIEFMNQHEWDLVAKTCRALTLENAPRFFNLLNSLPIAALNESFIAQLCSIPIQCTNTFQLQQMLYTKYNIEIPIMSINGKQFIRYSIQAFNKQEDLDCLYNALKEIIKTTSLLAIGKG